jgi:hypothetical protein
MLGQVEWLYLYSTIVVRFLAYARSEMGQNAKNSL